MSMCVHVRELDCFNNSVKNGLLGVILLILLYYINIIHNVFVTQGSQFIGLAFKAPAANLFTNR